MYRRKKVVIYQQSLAGPSFNSKTILGFFSVWKLACEIIYRGISMSNIVQRVNVWCSRGIAEIEGTEDRIYGIIHFLIGKRRSRMNMPHEKPSRKASVLSCWGSLIFSDPDARNTKRKRRAMPQKISRGEKLKGKNIEGGEDSLQPARKPSTRSKVRKKGGNHRSL